MEFMPLIVALLVLGLAYLLYRVLPEVIDFEKSFLWIIAGFIVIYIGAAIYLSYSLPAIGQVVTPFRLFQSPENSTVTDVIVRP